ncbi:hypothetical protein B0T24DRAFT_598866 [Lasiosphaeria ovina]|uniref:Uncharacterized protein n=1 Tax=Lasiosphaeria ovina TaxID=92902 RepID=A0AAE0MYU2_9PEZI|nr:hypothetical protein B0T24DRAFT_598866 [Lasiosphaeria ovina]
MKFTYLICASLFALSSALPSAGPIKSPVEERACNWACNVFSDVECNSNCKGCSYISGSSLSINYTSPNLISATLRYLAWDGADVFIMAGKNCIPTLVDAVYDYCLTAT